MNSFEQQRENPLAFRKTGHIKRAWKLWRFEVAGKKAQKKREKEFLRLLRK